MSRQWGSEQTMVLLVVGAAAVLFSGCEDSKAKARPAAGMAAPGGGAPQDRAVPVLAAKVEKKDVPIYLEGLGSVAAFNTVTVKAQVDGRIQRIAFVEGQEVKRGELLVEIDPRPFEILVHKGEAALAKDQAALKNAQVNLERYRALRGQKLVAQQQVDDQQALVDQAAAALEADRAQIEDAKLQLTYSRVTSPIDGRTGVRLIDMGNLVHANDQNGVVIITQLDPIAVFFTLPEDELPRVQGAMDEGKLKVEALARDGKSVLGEGTVALIDNQINQATGTIRLKAIFENPKRRLWPNEFVKARLRLQTKKDALVVPAAVVQRGPSGTFAYAIEDEKAVVKPVEVETIAGDTAILKGGLEVGETVVVEGQYRLAPGGKVIIRTPGGPAGPAGSTGTQTTTDSRRGGHMKGRNGSAE